MNLVDSIEFLKDKIKQKENYYKEKISKLKTEIRILEIKMKNEISPLIISVNELRKSNTVCEYCKGSKLEYYMDAAGSRDYKDCSYCNDTGESKYI